MNDEAEVGFVEAHAKRNGGDQRFDLVVELHVLHRGAVFDVAVIGKGVESALLQPGSDPPVAFGKRVYNSAALKFGERAASQASRAGCEGS